MYVQDQNFNQSNSCVIPDAKLVCIAKSSAQQLCSNVNCKHFPFLCANLKCKCHQKHEFCLKITKLSLTKTLEKKLEPYLNIEKQIKQQIKKATKELTEIQSQLLIECRQKLKDFIGLTKYERRYLFAAKLGITQEVSGRVIHKIWKNLQTPFTGPKMMENLEEEITASWKEFSQSITKMQTDIKQRLFTFGKENFRYSKVITSMNEANLIHDFFQIQDQQIKCAKLLYRGSENNFTAASFHKFCDNQAQTITFCESTNGKKFGGFATLAWNSNNKVYEDASKKTFVFNLTNNHKFKPVTATPQICCYGAHGPMWGKASIAYDLYIANNCNVNSLSCCNINNFYTNQNYTKQNVNSMRLMTGSPNGLNFQVKQYQVWKVWFE